MFSRLRTTWLAGSGALLLILAVSGAALGATVLTSAIGPTPEAETDPLIVDTTATFEDLDGDGVDDDCDAAVLADPVAAAAAQAAVDVDGDGTVSVDEAARSDRTGGLSCNHGGYVSQVARAQGAEDCVAEAAPVTAPTEAPAVGTAAELEAELDEDGDDAEEALAAPAPCPADEEDAEATAEEACEATVVPTFDPATATGAGAFGAYVSTIARSDAVGGRNCNHGGAVSEAVKAAREAAREAREAARAERSAERAAAKADREAARAERAAARADDAKGVKGKGHGRP